MRAYADLEEEGFVASVPGKGCFVLPKNQEFIREQKLREIEEHLLSAIDGGRTLRMPDSELRNMLDILMKERG
jgi:GntR family transcriptional regulator